MSQDYYQTTRTSSVVPFLGTSKELPSNILPSNRERLLAYFDIRLTLMKELTNGIQRNVAPSYTEIEAILVDKLIDVWLRASSPQVITKKSIGRNFKCLFEKLVKLSKSKKEVQELHKLLDICQCKCPRSDEIAAFHKMKCTCPIEQRVLHDEVPFLFD